MKSKKTNKAKPKDSKSKAQKGKKLTPTKMKIIKGGQVNPSNNPGGCSARQLN